MKAKYSLVIIALFAISYVSSAQDTVRYGDPWYQFKPMPDNPDDPSFDWSTDRYLGFRPSYGQPEMGPIQLYPNTGGTIYGIAVTQHQIQDPELFDAVLTLFRGVSIELVDSFGHCDITVSEKDSIIAQEAPLTKQCVFEYEYRPGGNITKLNNCTEYYFNTPIKLGRSKDSTTDTDYFIGGYIPANCIAKGIGVGTDKLGNQQWYLYSRVPGESVDCQLYYSFHPAYSYSWGGLFPIVKLRCTVPRGLRIAGGADVTALWRSNTDAELFQLSVCTGDVPADSGLLLTTTDTSLALPTLSPDSTYRIYLRKQCTYCTPSWADTVWSDWSAPVTIEASTGIRGVDQVSFTISPNPAKGAVRLECGEPMLDVEVMDMAGRTVSSESAVMGSELTLDVHRLPAGVYTVRVTTATGTALRRLAVE